MTRKSRRNRIKTYSHHTQRVLYSDEEDPREHFELMADSILRTPFQFAVCFLQRTSRAICTQTSCRSKVATRLGAFRNFLGALDPWQPHRMWLWAGVSWPALR